MARKKAEEVTEDTSMGAPIVTGPDPRSEMLEQLADTVRESNEEYSAAHGMSDETPEEPEEAPEEETQEEETEQEAEELVTLNIDGEMKQVPVSKVKEFGIRAMQKELAADKKLAEAKQLLDEVKSKFTAPSSDGPDQPSSRDAELSAAELAHALQYGDEEESRKAVERLMGRGNSATPEQIAGMAVQRMEFLQAVDWVKTEYADVIEDPVLSQVLGFREDALRDAGDTRPFKEVYKEICEDLRAWRGKVATPTSLQDKAARKASVTSLPSASMRQAAPEPEKPESVADIVEQMRRERGQA